MCLSSENEKKIFEVKRFIPIYFYESLSNITNKNSKKKLKNSIFEILYPFVYFFRNSK